MKLIEKIFGTGKKALYAELLLICFFVFFLLFMAGIIFNRLSLSAMSLVTGLIVLNVLGVYYNKEKNKELKAK